KAGARFGDTTDGGQAKDVARKAQSENIARPCNQGTAGKTRGARTTLRSHRRRRARPRAPHPPRPDPGDQIQSLPDFSPRRLLCPLPAAGRCRAGAGFLRLGSSAMEWAQASEIAAAVAAGKTSVSAVVDAALARIAKYNPRLNAFTAVVGDRARKRAA